MRRIRLFAIVLCAACAGPAAPAPTPPPAAAVPTAQRPPPPPAVEPCRCITMCFVQRGQLREIRVIYNWRTGVTLTTDSLPISTVAPLTGEYASVAGWYVTGESIYFRGLRYAKFGLPRVLDILEVERAGEYRGVPVFVETGTTAGVPEILYLPTRPGCMFQPYAGESAQGS